MAKKVSEAAVSDQVGAAQGEAEHGGGDMDAAAEAIIAAGRDASVEQLGAVADYLDREKQKFSAAYPHFASAIDAWQATGAPLPTGVRVVSLVEGFRRGGLAHGRQLQDYPLDALGGPDVLEALFAEPRLVVTFI